MGEAVGTEASWAGVRDGKGGVKTSWRVATTEVGLDYVGAVKGGFE